MVALVLGFAGVLAYTGLELGVSLVILLLTCFVTNEIFSRLFKAPTNIESWAITALILFFIMMPTTDVADLAILMAASSLAMASKFLFAYRKRHIFNPAAIALVILGLLGSGLAFWWVGSTVLTPAVVVIGLLIVQKIRRFPLFFVFTGASLATIALFGLAQGNSVPELWWEALTAWPLLFFATVMLTEPTTMPATKKLQLVYGVMVGLLFGSQFHFGPVHSSPELALVIGNVFAYIVSRPQKLRLTLTKKSEIAANVYELVFDASETPRFVAGQYLEWTLAHDHPDNRGNRRFFTVSSSPTEKEVKMGIRIAAQKSSTFKNSLVHLKEGATIMAGQFAGDFTLPADQSRKLVFIAGGIGVTPFRSMAKYLTDVESKRQVTLVYVAADPQSFAYTDVFTEAEKVFGMKTTYIVSNGQEQQETPAGWTGKVGRITADLVQTEVPHYREALFYLSGPNAMVEAYKKLLLSMGVKRKDIVTDYFPGF